MTSRTAIKNILIIAIQVIFKLIILYKDLDLCLRFNKIVLSVAILKISFRHYLCESSLSNLAHFINFINQIESKSKEASIDITNNLSNQYDLDNYFESIQDIEDIVAKSEQFILTSLYQGFFDPDNQNSGNEGLVSSDYCSPEKKLLFTDTEIENETFNNKESSDTLISIMPNMINNLNIYTSNKSNKSNKSLSSKIENYSTQESLKRESSSDLDQFSFRNRTKMTNFTTKVDKINKLNETIERFQYKKEVPKLRRSFSQENMTKTSKMNMYDKKYKTTFYHDVNYLLKLIT